MNAAHQVIAADRLQLGQRLSAGLGDLSAPRRKRAACYVVADAGRDARESSQRPWLPVIWNRLNQPVRVGMAGPQ